MKEVWKVEEVENVGEVWKVEEVEKIWKERPFLHFRDLPDFLDSTLRLDKLAAKPPTMVARRAKRLENLRSIISRWRREPI